MPSAIVLFAHGARDPEWAQPFHKIREHLRHELPGTPIVVAFLECMQPALESAVSDLAAQGVRRITLIPMFLARGGHLKEDLPELLAAIRQRHPDVAFQISPAIGEVDAVLRSLAGWVCAEHRSGSREK
ncbi:MAG: cobalamin biosynthesis protein CbiX [Gallionella sp.]|nr:MAG: cobalamin biosynthesis protein CbiX [Gallionella sp.]